MTCFYVVLRPSRTGACTCQLLHIIETSFSVSQQEIWCYLFFHMVMSCILKNKIIIIQHMTMMWFVSSSRSSLQRQDAGEPEGKKEQIRRLASTTKALKISYLVFKEGRFFSWEIASELILRLIVL
ncbi:hypothetical protein Lalb_Chr11g0071561 [Lupinus albus]|uniref:Uncharacterized protein n=1 Tax=Lupinus albus TaxID=3870 RepID=A0A6A4PS95_LUPAL|nr:hypothetical protein Lalb_Chr11g0071561 [Lupinus albus]